MTRLNWATQLGYSTGMVRYSTGLLNSDQLRGWKHIAGLDTVIAWIGWTNKNVCYGTIVTTP